MKNYGCYSLCCFLLSASVSALFAAFAYGSDSPKLELESCGLKSHNYVVTKPYNVILKTLQNLPAGCITSIKRVTISNNSAFVATVEVVWV